MAVGGRGRRPDLTLGELPALATYTVDGRDPLLVKTFLTSRLLDAGILGGPVLYASVAHTPELLDHYFEVLAPILREIATLDDGGSRRAPAPWHRAIGVRPAHVRASGAGRAG